VTKQTEIPDWETLLAHAALLQTKIPAAILVGGTAAAVHAGHRISFDHDHVVKRTTTTPFSPWNPSPVGTRTAVEWQNGAGKCLLEALHRILLADMRPAIALGVQGQGFQLLVPESRIKEIETVGL
jgi:hypothetical protein